MRNAEPRVVFLDSDLSDAFDHVAGGDANLAATIYVAGALPLAIPTVLAGAKAMTFGALRALPGADASALVAPKPKDTAIIMTPREPRDLPRVW